MGFPMAAAPSLGQRLHPTEARSRLPARGKHFPPQDLGRRLDRCRLKFLLRLKVGEQSAFADPDLLSQFADRQAIRLAGGGGGAAACRIVCGSARRPHVVRTVAWPYAARRSRFFRIGACIIARPVVLSKRTIDRAFYEPV